VKKFWVIPVLIGVGFAFSEKEVGSDKSSGASPISKTSSKTFPAFMDSVEGDFNGDRTKEFALVQKDENRSGQLLVENHCTVRFTNANVATLNTDLEYTYGNIWNEGDLDGDGADELALVVYDRKEWSVCYIFSFKKKWYLMAEPFMVWGGLDEDDIKSIPGKKGHIQIKELTIHEDSDSLFLETHIVKIYKGTERKKPPTFYGQRLFQPYLTLCRALP
jgi:hypothetical protein